ncbi:MAG: hypothetical protein ACK505_12495 [Flavobacteriales bacterium]|jgi:hypothetical protein
MDTQVIHEALNLVKLAQDHGFAPKAGAYHHYARSFYLPKKHHMIIHVSLWILRLLFYAGLLYTLIKLLS